MKCQDFETAINDLARGQSVEAPECAAALAHTEHCRRCAQALEEQRALAAGVQSTVASLASCGASVRVEEALRRAFHEQTRQAKTKAIKTPLAWWRHWPRWATVALGAAAILVLALLAGRMWVKSKPADQKQEAHHPSSAPADFTFSPQKEVSPGNPINVRQQPLAQVPPSERSKKMRHITRQPVESETEAATQFYPLMGEDGFVSLESGQVVRIEMPASTLIAMGLPIAAENRNQSVQADVLVGQDGLARAIRFLR